MGNHKILRASRCHMGDLNLMQRLRRLHCLRGQSNNYLRFARPRWAIFFFPAPTAPACQRGPSKFSLRFAPYVANLSLHCGISHTSSMVAALSHARTTLLALAVGSPHPLQYSDNPPSSGPSWGPDPSPPREGDLYFGDQ